MELDRRSRISGVSVCDEVRLEDLRSGKDTGLVINVPSRE